MGPRPFADLCRICWTGLLKQTLQLHSAIGHKASCRDCRDRSHPTNCVGGGKAERTNNRILRHSQRSCASISSISASEPYRSVKVRESQ